MSSLTIHSLIRRIDLFTIKLFLTAIEEGQIGRAAAREHVAASAATKRIQDLEELVGLKLFDRNARGVVPSQAGLAFARHAHVILATLDEMRRELAAYNEGVRGHVAIAAPGLLIVQFLAREIGIFTQRFPQVEVRLRQETNPDALRALVSGEVDLAVFSVSVDTDYGAIDSYECRTDRLVAVVPVDHPLARETGITLEQLLDQELIALGPMTSIMINLRHAAGNIGREPKIKYAVSNVEAARSLVGSGLGVTLQPACMLFPDEHDGVRTIHIDGEWAERSYHVAKPRGRALGPAAEALIEQLTSVATVLTEEAVAESAGETGS